MMIRRIIETLGLSSSSVGEISASLSETVVTHRDSTPKNYAEMVRSFGLVAAEGILQALTAANLHGAAAVYTGVGIDLSLDVSQQQLDALAAAVPQLAEACAAMKLIGRRTAPRWQASGLEQMPSDAEITAALQSIADSQAVATFFNETLNPLVSSGASKTDVKAAVAAW